ncbi:MAG: SPOR domain-containing protein [Bacteroidales bacterium]|nr:SPOR domain-containing protein [Bacteroidales bacterium]MBR6280193.1 SPOR domain-containing protein [Bacteroidales bacterium]
MANVTKKGLGGLSVSVLILGALALGGCDFVRRVAGRPTGEEIAQKRELIRAKEQAAAAAQEVAQAAQAVPEAPQAPRPDAASFAALRAAGCLANSVSALGLKLPVALSRNYYIITGSFAERENAEALAAKLLSQGFESELIPFSARRTAVGACPSDGVEEIVSAYRKLLSEGGVPKDSWILVNY